MRCFVHADMLNILCLLFVSTFGQQALLLALRTPKTVWVSYYFSFRALFVVAHVTEGGLTLHSVLLLVAKALMYDGATQKLNDKTLVSAIIIELINLRWNLHHFHTVIIAALYHESLISSQNTQFVFFISLFVIPSYLSTEFYDPGDTYSICDE